MSRSDSACFRRSVTLRSASLGSGLPEGWLWNKMRATALRLQRALGDDPAMNFAAVDGAAEEMLGCEDVVLVVQEDDPEDFVTQMCAAGNQVIAGLVGAVDPALALKALLQDIRCREENPLLVHLELILNCSVLGALHRFFSTSALCASWEPAGEAFGSTAPGSEHRASGAQRRAATKRQRREGGLPLRLGQRS